MFNLFQFLQSNFLKVSFVTLLVGTLWVTFAVTYALFRDTTNPTTMAAKASIVTVQATATKPSENSTDGYQFWFRQRTSKPFTVPVEQAFAQPPSRQPASK